MNKGCTYTGAKITTRRYCIPSRNATRGLHAGKMTYLRLVIGGMFLKEFMKQKKPEACASGLFEF
jgi:hypothetical protein